MTEIELQALLDDADRHVADELECMPEVEDKGHDLDVGALPFSERVWHKVTEAVAVFVDLKSSTRLDLDKYPASTASIYEAATGNVAEMFYRFEADFIAIQGDGAFALFWGPGRRERAICAAITAQTFGIKSLTPRLEKKWEKLPETGLKVGVAFSSLLAKRIGVEGDEDSEEPVWAGKAVNYAAKCAQQADRMQLIVTGSMWEWISKNDYLSISCGCGDDGPSSEIWQNVTIDKIPETSAALGDREGKLLVSQWCDLHGEEFCNAVLAGKRKRSDEVSSLASAALVTEYKNPKRAAARDLRSAQRGRSASDVLEMATEARRTRRAARITGLRKK